MNNIETIIAELNSKLEIAKKIQALTAQLNNVAATPEKKTQTRKQSAKKIVPVADLMPRVAQFFAQHPKAEGYSGSELKKSLKLSGSQWGNVRKHLTGNGEPTKSRRYYGVQA